MLSDLPAQDGRARVHLFLSHPQEGEYGDLRWHSIDLAILVIYLVRLISDYSLYLMISYLAQN